MTGRRSAYAVIGLGSIGLRPATNLIAAGRPVVGFDPQADRRTALAAAGGDARASRDDALEDAFAAVIASPSPQHLADLRAALAVDCHVLVEKPLAHVTDGVCDLIEEAARHQRRICAAMNQRFNPAIHQARDWLRDGRVGGALWGSLVAASYLPDWRPAQDHRQGYADDPRTGGALFDHVHEIDLAHYLFGPGQVVAASARNTGAIGIAAEDCADVVLRHGAGPQSHIHVDYVTRPPMRRIDIAGTHGRIAVDVRGRTATLLGVDGAALDHVAPASDASGEYRAEIDAFVAAVERDEPFSCNGREALDVLRCVIAARSLAGLPAVV